MNWKRLGRQVWRSGMKDAIDVEVQIAELDDNSGVFVVLSHHNKKGDIKKYSVWYQDREMINRGGENFALKIKNCDSFQEGRRIAENYYEDFKENNNPKFIGTQYLNDDILFSGPFIV